MLKINQIYKVKEGHEGRCDRYRGYEGAFIRITGNDKHGIIYSIFDKNNIRVSSCKWCFTEDDLELEEEVKVVQCFCQSEYNENGEIINCTCGKCKDIETIKPKSLEDLEFIECANCKAKPGSPYLCTGCYNNRTVISRLKELINGVEMSPSEAETLLEEKLGYKVKIK